MSNKERLNLLIDAEIEDIYSRPKFNDNNERDYFFTLNEGEHNLLKKYTSIKSAATILLFTPLVPVSVPIFFSLLLYGIADSLHLNSLQLIISGINLLIKKVNPDFIKHHLEEIPERDIVTALKLSPRKFAPTKSNNIKNDAQFTSSTKLINRKCPLVYRACAKGRVHRVTTLSNQKSLKMLSGNVFFSTKKICDRQDREMEDTVKCYVR